MIIKFNLSTRCKNSSHIPVVTDRHNWKDKKKKKIRFWFSRIKLGWSHNNGSPMQLLEIKRNQTDPDRNFKSTEPAETEVSHVNWILEQENRFIPHRQAARPPAATTLEKYSKTKPKKKRRWQSSSLQALPELHQTNIQWQHNNTENKQLNRNF